MSELNYRSSGVDLDQYEQAMARLPALLRRTNRPGVMEMPGGFGGLFRLNGAGEFRDPVLVSGSDGVGTKLRVAIEAGRFDTIGIDLVAMCSNDIACLGARPLFFLDYLAFGKDNPNLVAALVEGVSQGCLQAQVALLGGETAIMPGLYADGHFDMAGFCVGVVERDQILDGPQRIQTGDQILGLASSGFHSNGYSLIRKAVFEHAGLGVNDPIRELGRSVGDVLLTPTQIYNDFVNRLMNDDNPEEIRSLAHITGGGLAENVERILPDVTAQIDRSTWAVQPEFGWLQRIGGIADSEMDRVFNMGLGLVVVVKPSAVDRVQLAAAACEIPCSRIGEIKAGARRVEFVGH